MTRSNLSGTDPDIAILSQDSALILRAGVSRLRNSPTLFQNRFIGNTVFRLARTVSSPGNIGVGNIRTTQRPIILSATDSITTGAIQTGGDLVPFLDLERSNSFGGFVDLRAGGNIEVATIDTSGGGGNITIQTPRLFRETEVLNKANEGAIRATNFHTIAGSQVISLDDRISLPISIDTSAIIDRIGVNLGTINIEHGGKIFIIGPNVEILDPSRINATSSGFIYEDLGGGLSINALNFANIPNDASFTAGAILSNRDNGGSITSFRGMKLENSQTIGNNGLIGIHFAPTPNSNVAPSPTPANVDLTVAPTPTTSVPETLSSDPTPPRNLQAPPQENPTNPIILSPTPSCHSTQDRENDWEEDECQEILSEGDRRRSSQPPTLHLDRLPDIQFNRHATAAEASQ